MLQCGIELFDVGYNLLKIVVIINSLISNHSSGVSLPAFPSDFVETGFGCCGLLRRDFNKADFPGFELIRHPDD